MRPESIKSQAKRKKEAICGLLVFALLEIFYAAAVGSLCLIPGLPRWASILFRTLAALNLASILPALWALKTRIREIEGGELDAASHY